jgi:tetratricopeptide (TPR) repeat protein
MNCYSRAFLFTILALAAVIVSSPALSLADTEMQQPEPAAQTEEQESTPEYIEQYEAWEKADKEPDLLKRGDMLIEFVGKYPKSDLLANARGSYQNTLIECDNGGKYQELETLAEKWIKLNPGDLNTLAYIVKASDKLGHTEKWIQNLIEIYRIQPTASLANEIAQAYNKTKNRAKYLEWIETAFKYPEFESNFILRADIMKSYADAQDFAKAAEYAQKTLKAANLVKDPSAETKVQLRAVRKACNHLIGIHQYNAKKYEESLLSFQQALKAEKYAEGYFYIGQCLRQLGKAEEAMIPLAKAEKMGGEVAAKAKAELETVYKGMHNNTLIGIDKVYRKANETPD